MMLEDKAFGRCHNLELPWLCARQSHCMELKASGPRIKARYKSQGMWFILLLFFLSHISIAKFSLLFRSLPCSSPSAYGPTFLSVSLLVASPSSAVCPRIGSRAALEVSALNPCEQDKPNLPCCMQLVLLSIQRSFRLTQPNLTQSASSRGLRIRRNRAARRISSLSCCFCFPFHCPFTSFEFLGSGHCQVIHIMFLGLPPGVCLAPSSSVSVS